MVNLSFLFRPCPAGIQKTLLADCVQSRQTGFMQCFFRFGFLCYGCIISQFAYSVNRFSMCFKILTF
ncbi:hypothetical protein RUMCAL_02206 [Ruminococcus callidus ATCC 27760]|uniref:Uncharacterized protein n=1 Tax=Ruminococcus callidus ATCC 27760 TaxID=411473 RepID=U2K5K1_9FIRM|nr:hypothetical protein RUMCAL_02206 [Ruminococcus callidus ATCC 27760]